MFFGLSGMGVSPLYFGDKNLGEMPMPPWDHIATARRKRYTIPLSGVQAGTSATTSGMTIVGPPKGSSY